MNKKNVVVRMPVKMIRSVDALVDPESETRSDWIRDAVKEKLARIEA